MKRTTIMLPPDLRAQAGRHAHRLGISFGELVRLALGNFMSEKGQEPESDPLFSDEAVFTGKVPADLSANHDAHLYGEDD